MPFPLVPLIIAGAAGLAKTGVDAYQGLRATRYQRRQNALDRRNQEKIEREERKAAMRRALGIDFTTRGPELEQPDAPPSMTGSNIFGGLLELGGNLGATYAGGMKPKTPWKPTPGRTYI